jgi:hypothetical protein
MIRRPANDSSMADSGFPFFSLIVQIGMPVNELKSLARSLSLPQMRTKGFLRPGDTAKDISKIFLLLRSSSVILNSFFPFPMNKTQSLSPSLQRMTVDPGERPDRGSLPFVAGRGGKL